MSAAEIAFFEGRAMKRVSVLNVVMKVVGMVAGNSRVG
jgi:hypothetical protein